MSRPGDDFVPRSGDLVLPGRGDIFTDVGEWVVLLPIPHLACRIYWILRAHVNHGRVLPGTADSPDQRCWPLQEDMAVMVGLSPTSDQITTSIKRLQQHGAVDVAKERFKDGMRQRNIYTVHREAPAGFEGPRSVNQWYRTSRPAKE